MSRVHDMGGRYGDGPIPDKDDAEVFHSDWEARALAMNVACGPLGAWNIDMSRHAREALAPQDYARFTYYEKWMAGLADLLVAKGLVAAEELAQGDVARASLSERALRPGDVMASQRRVVPYAREGGPAPRFAVGDRVRTSDHSPQSRVPGGHTRLPRYAMGRVGTVVLSHGAHVFPDSSAHGFGDDPKPLYAVQFSAQDLWGDAAEAGGDVMVLDLWEPYLEEVS